MEVEGKPSFSISIVIFFIATSPPVLLSIHLNTFP